MITSPQPSTETTIETLTTSHSPDDSSSLIIYENGIYESGHPYDHQLNNEWFLNPAGKYARTGSAPGGADRR